MYVENTNYWVEVVLRQLKGFVPKGEPVHFHFCFSMVGGQPTIDFTSVQVFDEDDQLQPQTEPAMC